ncbi:MAG: hypothetical protein RMM08_03210 [Armatimonadota bacterium]|nr:hypothetical protein [Armatimonadota bacterium]
MNFPKNRMRITYSHEGRQSEKGWLVLDVRGLDLDGVNSIVIPLEDIEKLQEGSQQQANPLTAASQTARQKGGRAMIRPPAVAGMLDAGSAAELREENASASSRPSDQESCPRR